MEKKFFIIILLIINMLISNANDIFTKQVNGIMKYPEIIGQ